MDLTSHQIQAIRDGEPVRVVPPEIGEECVLLRKDIYERIAHLLDDTPPADEELIRLGWEAGKKIGWDTPEMSEYDDYDAHRP
jgi:hypothetical protein